MFRKSSRLKDASMFQKAFRAGKPFFFNGVGCKALMVDGDRKRVGFAVSKKIFPKAVERNKAKRIMADALSPHFESIPEGVQLVFFLRDGTLDRVMLQEAMARISEKIKTVYTKRV